MISFEELFLKSGGKPVEYNGRSIQMVDRFIIPKECNLKVIFENSKPGWRQGVHLSTSGQFTVNGQNIRNAIVLWKDEAPQEVEVGVSSSDGVCLVKNVWDTGDGTMHSWHNGAAMMVEERQRRHRYLCNDGKQNDDFDDLIFQIELLP